MCAHAGGQLAGSRDWINGKFVIAFAPFWERL
jgi:hypothetical protein